MKAYHADLPVDEDARLEVMRCYRLNNVKREVAFDRLASLAAEVTGCPIALVNLLDRTVQNTIGAHGLDLHCLERKVSFCTRTIMADPPFVVRDARSHPLFETNELVLGPPHIRFYAGVPIVIDGRRVGALCLIDTVARDIDPVALSRLHHFAQIAQDMLVTRLGDVRFSESQSRLEMLQDSVPVAVVIYDAERRFIRSNARYRETFFGDASITPAQGTPFADVLDMIEKTGRVRSVDGFGMSWRRERLKLLELGISRYYVNLVNGVCLSCVETKGENGELLIAFVDVTESRKREAVLQEQTNLLRAILDNIDHGMALFDASARLMVCNEQFFEMLDVPVALRKTGVALRSMLSLFTDETIERLARPEEGAGSDASVMRTIEISRPDGQTLALSLARMADCRIVVTCADVTESKELVRIKDEFVSTVSHELRTPLTAISGSLGLLKGGAGGALPSKAGRLIDVAFRNSERLAQLVNDLLDIGKLDSEEMVLDRDVVDLGDLVRAAVEANQPYAARFGVTLQADVATGAVKVEGDMRRLLQVAANLISNAAKFSPAGGTVTVGAARSGAQGRFFVVDQGPGIPEHFRKKLFKRFAQADGSDRRGQEGTGLGLSITKAIVDRHGGTIAVQTGEGRGTRFDVDFPLFDQAALAADDALKRTVLICQKTDDAASAVRRIVSRGNAAADVTTVLDEALGHLAARHYDLVVFDATMQDRTGQTVVSLLKDQPALVQAPVFLTSAEDSDQTALRSRGVNVVDWIEKAVDLPRIARALAQSTRRDDAKCRVLHVEDAPIIASVVAASLAELAHVDAAQDLATARRMLAGGDYDIMIVDVGLPDGSGLELLQLAADLPGRPIAVIVFSSVEDPEKVSPSVHKFLSKTGGTIAELVDTVRSLTRQGEGA